jgi:hypothetical protein
MSASDAQSRARSGVGVAVGMLVGVGWRQVPLTQSWPAGRQYRVPHGVVPPSQAQRRRPVASADSQVPEQHIPFQVQTAPPDGPGAEREANRAEQAAAGADMRERPGEGVETGAVHGDLRPGWDAKQKAGVALRGGRRRSPQQAHGQVAKRGDRSRPVESRQFQFGVTA